jgi:flagellar hook-length control protein FliK
MIDNILTNSISPPAVSSAAKSRSRTTSKDDAQDDFAEVLKNKEKEQSKTDDADAAAAASQMQQQKPADNPQVQDKSTDDSGGQPEYAAKVPAPSASTVSRGALQPSVQVQVPTDLANLAAANASAAATPAAAPATPAGVAQAETAQQTATATAAAAGASQDSQPQVVALDNKQNFEDVLKTAASAQKGSADPAAAAPTATVQAAEAVAPAALQTAKPSAQDTASELKPAAARINEKAPASTLTDSARPVDAGLVTAQNPLQETAHAAATVKQPALPLENQPLTVVQQMMNHLEASIQQGRGSIHMQLNPQELGAIDIHLVNSAQGVSVNVFAEQASTGRLLETQMNQLRQALTDAGVQLSNLNVSQHGQPNQQNQQGSSFNRSPQYGRPGGESSNSDEPRQGHSRSLLSGVDYLI